MKRARVLVVALVAGIVAVVTSTVVVLDGAAADEKPDTTSLCGDIGGTALVDGCEGATGLDQKAAQTRGTAHAAACAYFGTYNYSYYVVPIYGTDHHYPGVPVLLGYAHYTYREFVYSGPNIHCHRSIWRLHRVTIKWLFN